MEDKNAGKSPEKQQVGNPDGSSCEREAGTLASTSAMTSSSSSSVRDGVMEDRTVWTPEIKMKFLSGLSRLDVTAKYSGDKGSDAIPVEQEQVFDCLFERSDSLQLFDKMPQRIGESESISSVVTEKEAEDAEEAGYGGEMVGRFGSLAKFMVNIKRWKERALARLTTLAESDIKLRKRVADTGSLAPVAEKRRIRSQRSIRSEVADKKGGNPRSLAIVRGRIKKSKLSSSLSNKNCQVEGERGAKFGSLVKFVMNIKRWKKRVSSRLDQLVPILKEDAVPTPTAPPASLNSKVNPTPMAETSSSSCTLVHDDPIAQDMDLDITLSPKTDRDHFHVDASPFDGATFDDSLLYCALFPPDHEFEKETLVQLWMAVGFFVEEPMERFAGLFFDDCLTKGYLQFCRNNLVTGKSMYKFKGDSLLLPKLISRGNHIVRKEGSSNLSVISPEVSHLSIRCCNLKDSTSLCGFHKFKHLRTLILFHGHEMSFKQVPRDFFIMMWQLRVLDLSKTRLMELPSSIGKMKCLFFLNLSYTLIKRLPESIVGLEKLQTLKLRGCSNLFMLPKGMRKLVNLRHLDFDVFRQLRSMPKGMGDLTNIRTLSAFLVGLEKECSIRQIKNMNNLSGSLCISRLENVLTKDEAEEACLSNKTQLKKIELHWSDSPDEDVVEFEKVLSSLQPNTSLEELNISCYGGIEIPSWICDPKFSQLACITLFECENCLVLPSLGQLPSLKYLNIVNFHKLKVIDHNFYGDLGIQGYVAFPKLEKLTVENMSSLEEWLGIRSFEFPCLLNLTVKHCPKLHSLCTLSSLCSLENLEISHCAMLACCPHGKLPAQVKTVIIESCPLISARFLNGGQDSQYVAHIPHIWINHREISRG